MILLTVLIIQLGYQKGVKRYLYFYNLIKMLKLCQYVHCTTYVLCQSILKLGYKNKTS